MNPVYMYRFIRSLLVIGGIILGGIALFYLSKYTYPFIIAMIIAFLMNPLVTFFEKKGRLATGIGCIRFPFTHFPFICGTYHLTGHRDHFRDQLPCRSHTGTY